MNPYKYLILLLVPLTVLPGFAWFGYLTFLTPFCCFIILPVFDLLPVQFKPSAAQNEFSPSIFRWLSFLFVPVVWLLIITGCFIVASHWSQLSVAEFSGIILSVGIVNGTLGFTLAHEFIHKHNLPDQVAGHVLLASSNFMHYSIEHVYGHHVQACTIQDPNSARLGETFYHFFIRSITGGYKSAWQIEGRRLKKLKLSFFSFHNKMICFQLIQVTVLLLVLFTFGWYALLFFAGQSFISILLHQAVNYIQHYGLSRDEHNGHHEKMKTHHSWSIPGSCKIVDLFQVQNHAHHHIHASTPYYKLVAEEQSPRLPANYAAMIVVSLIPPLWFRIIHPQMSKIPKPKII